MKHAYETNKKAEYFEDKQELATYLKGLQLQDSQILIKGSRGMSLETLLESFWCLEKIRGMDVTIVTNSNSSEKTIILLKEFNLPIVKGTKKKLKKTKKVVEKEEKTEEKK